MAVAFAAAIFIPYSIYYPVYFKKGKAIRHFKKPTAFNYQHLIRHCFKLAATAAAEYKQCYNYNPDPVIIKQSAKTIIVVHNEPP